MPAAQNSTPTPGDISTLTMCRYIFAGLSASLIGIGLARFAYTPLIPPLIKAQWFPADDVVYLGAANLAGYLIGAMVGRSVARRFGNVATLRSMKIVVTLSFLACAFPLSVGWFFVWRLLSGVAGGVIMVLVAATILPHMPYHRRGIAGGAVFLGVGLGIAASGTVVPLLLRYGLQATWIGLGALSGLLTIASWTSWPRKEPPPEAQTAAPKIDRDQSRAGASVALIYAVYALMAAGLVAPMVFLVDFIARGLQAGDHVGSLFWIVYGLGAMAGPPVYGYITDRLGGPKAVRLLLFVQAIALASLAMTNNFIEIGILTVIIGSFPPGIAPLVLGWVREVCPGDLTRQNVIWSRATIVFAAFQTLAGYAFSAVFSHSNGSYWLLFAMSAVLLAFAFALELFVPLLARRRLKAIAS